MKSRGILLALVLLSASAGAEEAWKQIDEKDGVTVFTRPTASGIDDLRAVGLVEASPERVLAMISDVEAYPQTMPYVETSRLVKREGNVVWQYAVVAPPVVSRRDYCIRITLSALPEGGFRSTWVNAPELAPTPADGVIRIVDTSGSWTLEPVDGGTRTRATYEQHSEPGGWIPRFMVNGGSAKTGFATFKAVREAVATKYANARSPLAVQPPPAPAAEK